MEQKHRSLLEQSKKVSLLANIRSRVRTVTDLYYPIKSKREHSQVCRKEPRGQHDVIGARQVTSQPRCKNAGSVNSRHQLVLILSMDIAQRPVFVICIIDFSVLRCENQYKRKLLSPVSESTP